ncbi:hypothetical protein BU17DRAFT_65840 [Hysterangium stoloniferum]|nr:hypothetical protein BU17DRAFT_65840 [Hysterangium stoloniferum]
MLSGQAITRLASSTPSSLKIQSDQFFHRIIKGYIITTSLNLLIGSIGFEAFHVDNILTPSRNFQETFWKPSDLLILFSSQGIFSTSRILSGELLILWFLLYLRASSQHPEQFQRLLIPLVAISFLQYPYNIQDISNSEYSKVFRLCSH